MSRRRFQPRLRLRFRRLFERLRRSAPELLRGLNPVSSRGHEGPGDDVRLSRVIAFYAALTVLITWPLLPEMASHLVGDARSDTWKHAWGYWWFWDAWRSQRILFPTRTTAIGYPNAFNPLGGSLYNIDPVGSLLSIPLQAVVGLPAAYNLVILANLTAGGTACWMLARRLCGDARAALVAGVVYAFCPFILSYALSSGVTETLNLLWMPLFLLLLLNLPRRGLRNAAMAGTAGGLTCLACWYYGYFIILWTLLWGGWSALVLWWRRGFRAIFGTLRVLGPCLLVFCVIFVDVLTPPLVSFWMSLQNPDSQHPAYISARDPAHELDYLQGMEKNSVALDELFLPGRSHAVVSFILDRLVKSAYVGGSVWVLAILGLFGEYRTRRMAGSGTLVGGMSAARPPPSGRDLQADPPVCPEPQSRLVSPVFFCVSALFFAILALGPRIMLDRNRPALGSNLLYRGLYMLLPGFTQIAIPYRFCVPMMLSMGILASFGLAFLLRGRNPAQCTSIGGGVAILVVLEFLFFSPAPHPLPLAPVEISPVDRAIAGMSGFPAVLDLPADWITGRHLRDRLLPGTYFYDQSVHGKAIPYRISGRMAPEVESNGIVATVRAWTNAMRLPHSPTLRDLEPAVMDLRRMGFGVVILHTAYVPVAVQAKVEGLLDRLLGAPFRSGTDRFYFLVPRPSSLSFSSLRRTSPGPCPSMFAGNGPCVRESCACVGGPS